MSGDGQRLRAALIQSLQQEPLLVEAEEVLHSAGETEMRQKFRGDLMQMLDEGPPLAEVDGLTYLSIEREIVEKFRAAMEGVLRGGSSLADAEREVLQSLGFEKLGEFRSKISAHLGGPAEIPDQDLAIYVPAGEGRGLAFKEALEEQLSEIAVQPEAPLLSVDEEELAPEVSIEPRVRPEVEALPSVGEALPPWDPFAAQVPKGKEQDILTQASVLVTAPEMEALLKVSAPMVADGLRGLNPVPMLTAALEAAGVEGEDFGFILRYGRYAPEGRKSEFIVGGLGLADLSNRLTSWLRAQGPMEAQIQVVDEGSGELTIYLLAPEGA